MAGRKTRADETREPVERAGNNAGGDAAGGEEARARAPSDQRGSAGEETAGFAADAASAGDAADPAGPNGSDGSLREQLQAAVAERDANRENWLRAQAELENYRRRVQREMDESRRYQVAPLARDVLPVLDNLRRAIGAAEEGGDASGLVEGVRLVLKQLEDTLARHEVTPIPAVGQPFDPNLHEALQQVPSAEHPAMTVVDEYQRGYRLHDRVLRPSQVVVSGG